MNAAFLGNEQGDSFGARKLSLIGFVVAAVAMALLIVMPASKATAATVTNPGPTSITITSGFLKLGGVIEQSLDTLEENPVINGTVDASGNFNAPPSGFNFGQLVFDADTGVLGVVTVGIDIIPTQNITGTVDPITGAVDLDLNLRIHATKLAGSALISIGNNCNVTPVVLDMSTSTGPAATSTPGLSLGGIPYNLEDGTARVADKTFFAPAATNCGSLGGTLNEQLGLPSASGQNAGEFSLSMSPAPMSNATITIGTRPAAATNQTNANFGFSSNVPSGLTYECQLDSGAWVNCDSKTASYTGLADGSHTFRVRAMAGSTQVGASSYTWSIDTVIPVFTVNGAPSGLTNSRNANITFTSSKTLAPSNVTCTLDGTPVTPCTSPRNLTGLADGSHTWSVQGTDAVGNVGSASRSWTVDATKPTVNITSTPANPSSTSDVAFEFTKADNMTPNPNTQCQVRNMRLNLPAGQVVQAWTNCTSPNAQVRATGKWRFELRATDNAGNVSDIASYDWDANTAEPVMDSLIGPSGPIDSNTGGTRSSDAEFEFNAETFDIDGEIIAGTTFRYECWLDGQSLGACEPPMTLEDLTGGAPMSEGAHVFEVKPFLVATPEVPGFRTAYNWSVDNVDPTAAFENTPNAHHNSATAEFSTHIDGTGSNGTAQCKLDNGNWADCDSNTAHTVVVADGNHTLQLRAVDQAGNQSAAISHSWNTDTQLPTASIHETPVANDKSDTAKFIYKSNDNEAGVQAYCQLDDGEEAACARTSHTYESIVDSAHTFTLRVEDAAGNEVTRTFDWRSDTTAPALAITDSQPAALSNQTSAAFKLLSTDTDGSGIADVSCRIDGAAWEACENGNVWNFYTGPFASGPHEFEARVTDVAGNSTTRSHEWTVDTVKPDVAIATVIGETTSTSASIKFLSTEETATFECKLDAGTWGACTSPKAYSGLSTGNHVFQVRSVDTAGNRSEEDALAWIVKSPAAEVCPDGTTGTPPNCVNVEEPKCAADETGTPPNCVKKPDAKCDDGFVGTPPNCTKILTPLPTPNASTGTFDGKTLSIRLKCGAQYKPSCSSMSAVAVTKKNGTKMTGNVKTTLKAGKWKVINLSVKPAHRATVTKMTTVDRKQLTVQVDIQFKKNGKKAKKRVFQSYKVRAKG